MRLRNEHVERTFSGRRVRVAPAARIRDRAAARLRAGRLDLELARGAPPESTAALALRARRLTSLGCRRSIAETYLRLIRDARESARPRARIAPRRARIAPPRDQILGAGEALTRLAEKLARPGPVTARGVAEALVLLRDGTGPLYNGRSDANLRGPATSAERNLGLDEP